MAFLGPGYTSWTRIPIWGGAYKYIQYIRLYRYIIYGYLDMFVCIAYNSIKHESVTVAMITYNL